MKYQSTLLAVTNMERSKAFYCGLLGREVVADFGANVTLSGGITLQTLDTADGCAYVLLADLRFELI